MQKVLKYSVNVHVVPSRNIEYLSEKPEKGRNSPKELEDWLLTDRAIGRPSQNI